MVIEGIDSLANTSYAMVEVFKMMQYLVEYRTISEWIPNSRDSTGGPVEDPEEVEAITREAERLEKLDTVYHTLLDSAYKKALVIKEHLRELGED